MRIVDAMAATGDTHSGVLFLDLDGTLADSGAGITQALNEVLAGIGGSLLSPEEQRWIIGPPFQTTMPTILRTRGLDESMSQWVIDEYRRVYTEHHLPHTPRIDGIGDVVDELANSYLLAVVTAKPTNQARIAVESLDMHDRFEVVVGPEPDHPVPKAVLLRRAIAHIENSRSAPLDYGSCWMIGDRHHDIDAAVEVGTKSVGVLWGFGDTEELETAGATAIATVPTDLLSILLR